MLLDDIFNLLVLTDWINEFSLLNCNLSVPLIVIALVECVNVTGLFVPILNTELSEAIVKLSFIVTRLLELIVNALFVPAVDPTPISKISVESFNPIL